MRNALANKTFQHPYDMKTARTIRDNLIMQPDTLLRKEFLDKLGSSLGSKAAEIIAYIQKDYRVFIRDDQLWPDFKDTSWHGKMYCAGRALMFYSAHVKPF